MKPSREIQRSGAVEKPTMPLAANEIILRSG